MITAEFTALFAGSVYNKLPSSLFSLSFAPARASPDRLASNSTRPIPHNQILTIQLLSHPCRITRAPHIHIQLDPPYPAQPDPHNSYSHTQAASPEHLTPTSNSTRPIPHTQILTIQLLPHPYRNTECLAPTSTYSAVYGRALINAGQ